MKVQLLLASAMLLGLGAFSHAQFSRKPDLPNNSQQVIIRQLKRQLSLLKAKRQNLLHEYFAGSPEIRQVEIQVASLGQRLKRGQPQPTDPVHFRAKLQLLSS